MSLFCLYFQFLKFRYSLEENGVIYRDGDMWDCIKVPVLCWVVVLDVGRTRYEVAEQCLCVPLLVAGFVFLPPVHDRTHDHAVLPRAPLHSTTPRAPHLHCICLLPSREQTRGINIRSSSGFPCMDNRVRLLVLLPSLIQCLASHIILHSL